jgi:AraC-like DNA-binding protein
MTRVPPARHEVLHSRDPVAASGALRCLFGPHTLEVVDPPADFEVRHRRSPLGSLSLSLLDSTTAIRVVTTRRLRHHLVHVALTGSASARIDDAEVTASPERALVVSAGRAMDLRLTPGSRHLVLSLDRAALETTLRQTLGRAPDRPLVFDLELDLAEPHVRRWWATLALLRREVEDGPAVAAHPVAERHLQQLLMTELLVATRHSHSAALHVPAQRTAPPPQPVPPVVRRAVEVIEARAAEPLTVADVAGAVGTGVRSLQHGFRVHLATTPMAYLRRIRLERVRAELLAAAPDTELSVTDAAFRWGFVHPGRFAQAYRAAYGEPPSVTLRRGSP